MTGDITITYSHEALRQTGGAYVARSEEHDELCGYGETQIDAVHDLLEQIHEQSKLARLTKAIREQSA